MMQPGAALKDGRYKLERPLGKGGHATVWLAWDDLLQVHRAVKIVEEDRSSTSPTLKRFLNEARAMARIRHRHVLTVHDIGQDGPTAYLVMDVAHGGSASDRLRNGPLPLHEAVRLVAQVLDALQAAHDNGVIHRDVKPQNVLLDTDGSALVSDFGIARFSTEGASLTATGMAMGTWMYMAPEQREDAKSVDARADVYAAGATLYAIVSGRPPNDLYNPDLTGPVYAGIPAPVAMVVQNATRFLPESRYPSAAAMRTALLEAIAQVSDEITAPRAVPAATATTRNSLSASSLPTSATTGGFRPRPFWVLGSAAAFLGAVAVVTLVIVALWPPSDDAVGDESEATSELAPAVASSEGTDATPVLPLPEPVTEPSPAEPPPVKTPTKTPSTRSGKRTPPPVPSEVVAPVEPVVVAPVEVVAAPVAPTATVIPCSGTPPEGYVLAHVNVVPPGTIFVDGTAQGANPLRGCIRAGTHVIAVETRAADGSVAGHYERTVTLSGSEPFRFCWDMNAGATCKR